MVKPKKKDYYDLVEDRITAAVVAALRDPTDGAKLYELLLCGYSAYKGGLGLPHNSVHAAIQRGIDEFRKEIK